MKLQVEFFSIIFVWLAMQLRNSEQLMENLLLLFIIIINYLLFKMLTVLSTNQILIKAVYIVYSTSITRRNSMPPSYSLLSFAWLIKLMRLFYRLYSKDDSFSVIFV